MLRFPVLHNLYALLTNTDSLMILTHIQTHTFHLLSRHILSYLMNLDRTAAQPTYLNAPSLVTGHECCLSDHLRGLGCNTTTSAQPANDSQALALR